MSEERFQVVEHTADWSLRIVGSDLRELFLHAAIGMSTLMFEELESIAAIEDRSLELQSFDAESLLVDWLNELAFWAETEQLLFPNIHIQEITEYKIQATLKGGRAPELHKHIKAVTYHNLEIMKRGTGLEVTVVFDV